MAESDESDNRAAQTLTVTPPIIANLMLAAKDLVFNPLLPIAGDTVTMTLTVHNDGTGDANEVLVQLFDVTAGEPEAVGNEQTIPTIAAGGSAVISTTFDTTDKSGERRIQVVLDPANSVEESNEEDNQLVKTLRVLSEEERPEPQPNLVVKPAGLLFDPITPTVGSPVTITLTVTNSGEAPATDVIVEFADTTGGDAEVIGRQMITGTLPAGRSGRARLVYDTLGKQGVRTVTVTADPDNAITETDESDNQTSGTFTLTQGSSLTNSVTAVAPAASTPAAETALDQPNLVIINEDVNIFRADYVAVAAADTNLVTITARLHNNGMVAAGNVVVQFVAMTGQGWQVIGEQQLGLVEAGAEASAEIAVKGEEALSYREVRVLVDPDNAIFEANEADTRASQVVRLGE